VVLSMQLLAQCRVSLALLTHLCHKARIRVQYMAHRKNLGCQDNSLFKDLPSLLCCGHAAATGPRGGSSSSSSSCCCCCCVVLGGSSTPLLLLLLLPLLVEVMVLQGVLRTRSGCFLWPP
jgi:hypothetical protein